MSIAENIARIRAEIEAAAREAGRDPKEITLVGASKMNDAQACRDAIAGGIDALGENRVQEMTQKLSENAYEGAPLHFIGHLQRNKVKQVVGYVDLIQSVGAQSSVAPTVYFLDIRLSENEDTMNLYHHIQKQKSESYLIYVSAHPQYAMDCLHTHAFDFLLKPLMDEQLEDCMNALWRVHLSKTEDDLLQISMGGRMLLQQKILSALPGKE